VEVIAEFRRHQEVVVLEGVLHAGAHDMDGLDRNVDDEVEDCRQQHDLEEVAGKRFLLLLDGVAGCGRDDRHRRVDERSGRTATREKRIALII
jgi:hypothetical protein